MEKRTEKEGEVEREIEESRKRAGRQKHEWRREEKNGEVAEKEENRKQ